MSCSPQQHLATAWICMQHWAMWHSRPLGRQHLGERFLLCFVWGSKNCEALRSVGAQW